MYFHLENVSLLAVFDFKIWVYDYFLANVTVFPFIFSTVSCLLSFVHVTVTLQWGRAFLFLQVAWEFWSVWQNSFLLASPRREAERRRAFSLPGARALSGWRAPDQAHYRLVSSRRQCRTLAISPIIIVFSILVHYIFLMLPLTAFLFVCSRSCMRSSE